MTVIFRKGTNYKYLLPDDVSSALGLEPGAEYELIELSKGSFALVERSRTAPAEADKIDKKLFTMLTERSFSERVEGKFEKLLSNDEVKRLKELVKEGKVVLYKSSNKYKKAIYKLSEGLASIGKEVGKKIVETSEGLEHAAARAQAAAQVREQEPVKRVVEEKPPLQEQYVKPEQQVPTVESVVIPSADETKFAKQDYVIVKDENIARALSMRLSEEIRRREVLGTKTFDGEYYIIKKSLYDKCAPIILQYIMSHVSCTADSISNDLGIDKSLVKIVCEFLRESGEITERRKELYEYIT